MWVPPSTEFPEASVIPTHSSTAKFELGFADEGTLTVGTVHEPHICWTGPASMLRYPAYVVPPADGGAEGRGPRRPNTKRGSTCRSGREKANIHVRCSSGLTSGSGRWGYPK